MNSVYILSIESSCDETSLAIVKNGNKVIEMITNTQIEMFKDLGGVVPEMASRMHTDNIFYVYEALLESANMKIEEMDAIAVTIGPGLKGSLLVGINFAKSLALITGKRLIGVNHMQAHIYALNLEKKLSFPHLSLIVSGGHTEIIEINENLDFKKLGETLDDAVGEVYDKVARLLGLKYPGGPEIEKIALVGKDTYELPYPKNDETLDFSFSGLKSAVYNLVNQASMKNEIVNVENMAHSFQKRVIKILIKKFHIAYKTNDYKQISVVGGVSANNYLREEFQKTFDNIIFTSKKYSTDNGAMVASLGYQKYLRNEFVDVINLDAKSNLEI